MPLPSRETVVAPPSRGRHVAAPAPSAQPRRFLPEVQALRALAVGLVVLYHLYPRLAPGGFVGVDVFFVISGFLITSHLLREVEAKGRLDLPGFWAARIRRIMPAAIVVVLAVVGATLLWWPPSQWGEITRQGLASLLSVQNWVLAADAVDYMAADNAPTALQHFWSLGVEEQFYVLWPFVVLLGFLVARRVRRGAPGRAGAGTSPTGSGGVPGFRAVAALFFALVIAVSLVYSIRLVSDGDPAAYFVTTARVWEMAAGGLLAAVLPAAGWRAPTWLRSLVALAGVVVLAWVALSYSASGTPFPGQGAILPVLGTMAVIAAGRTSGPGSLHRLSDWAPVQWLGNVSYSLYLWHWPVVIVFQQLTGRHPRWWQAALLVGLSLLLAWASYRWIEKPARSWRFTARHTWRAVGLGTLATGLACAVVLVPTVRAQAINQAQEHAVQQLLAAPPSDFGAAAWDTANGAAFVQGEAVVPVPEDAVRDLPAWRHCVAPWDGNETKRCEFGDTSARTTVAIVGDSHAAQWIGALDELGRKHRWKIVSYVKNSCPFSYTPRKLEVEQHQACTSLNRTTVEALSREKPSLVLVSSWTGSTFAGDAVKGFEEPLRQLSSAGVPTAVVRDNPAINTKGTLRPRDCVAAHPETPAQCALPRAKALGSDPAETAANRVPGTEMIHTVNWFCGPKDCPVVVGNVLVYRDANHVSNTYARTLEPRLGARVSELLRAGGR